MGEGVEPPVRQEAAAGMLRVTTDGGIDPADNSSRPITPLEVDTENNATATAAARDPSARVYIHGWRLYSLIAGYVRCWDWIIETE